MTVASKHRVRDPWSLDPTALIDAAFSVTESDHSESVDHLDGLVELCSALDAQARLNDTGRGRVRASLVKAIADQVHVRRLRAARPDIDDIAVRPVFITGLLRTGTTFVQHLLAEHPDLRAPRLWELMSPAGPGEPDELIARCAGYVEEYYRLAPAFRSIHPLDAEQPEECHRLTANSFRDPIWALRYRVPGYAEWLDRQSMVPAYEFHAAQLRCVLARRPGNPVLLKGPSHLWYADALATVYPDALMIRMHRSPVDCIPSVCSLTSVVRSVSSSQVDEEEIGRYWLGRVASALSPLRRGSAPTRTPPLDVRYDDLLGDPMGTAELICDYIGVGLSAPAAKRIAAFVDRPRDHIDGHHYSAARFGLRDDEIARHFAGYLDEFELRGDHGRSTT